MAAPHRAARGHWIQPPFASEDRAGPRHTLMAKKRIPASLQPWIDARRRFHLSHEHVQMARELGMNPKKLGKLDNHHQEPWKLPLPQFIRKLYSKRFGKERPDAVRSIEEMVVAKQEKKQSKKAARVDARLMVDQRDDPTQ
jgi:hypothetical protein